MSTPRRVLACASILLAGGGLACGNGARHAGSDGGPATSDGPAGPKTFAGTHAFKVSATVTSDVQNPLPDGQTGPHTWTQSFTLVLAADTQLAILGTSGSGVAGQYQSNDGRTFQISNTFDLLLPGTDPCVGSEVDYGPMTLTLADDGHLTGTGQGMVCTIYPGTEKCSDATMVFAGGPDVDPPALTIGNVSGPITIDPFSVVLDASEPLPPSTRPKMISTSGDQLFLAPPPPRGVPALDAVITQFHAPVMLRYADTYTVLPDGVVDFAGDAATTTVQFQTVAAPPLAAQDGFESVTDATLGGATVISGAGYPVIAGAKSVYVPPPPRMTVQAAKGFALRLAVPPGATTIRFSYRTAVDLSPGPGFAPGLTFAWASAGQPVSSMTFAPAQNPTTVQLPDQTMVGLGPVTLAELPLAAGVGDEVTLTIFGGGQACASAPVAPSPGVIIDDLRVE